MKISKEDYFLNNPFSIKVMKDFSKYTRNFQKRPGFSFDQNNHHLLSPIEKYLSYISSKQSDLQGLSKQISNVRIFITRYPFKEYYRQNGIDQLDYIQYHIETLFHKINTIGDVMKLMINEVYQLNIPEIKCGWRTLCKKLDKSTPAMIILNLYNETFTEIIKLRNLNTHRGYYKDDAKKHIETDLGYWMYKLDSELYPIPKEIENMVPLYYLNVLVKQYRKDKLSLIDKIIQTNNLLLKEFLTSLLEPLNQKIVSF